MGTLKTYLVLKDHNIADEVAKITEELYWKGLSFEEALKQAKDTFNYKGKQICKNCLNEIKGRKIND